MEEKQFSNREEFFKNDPTFLKVLISEEPITLKEYALISGKSLRSVQLDAKANKIPTWRDPMFKRSRVTSIGAIERYRKAIAEKAEKEFLQKANLL